MPKALTPSLPPCPLPTWLTQCASSTTTRARRPSARNAFSVRINTSDLATFSGVTYSRRVRELPEVNLWQQKGTHRHRHDHRHRHRHTDIETPTQCDCFSRG